MKSCNNFVHCSKKIIVLSFLWFWRAFWVAQILSYCPREPSVTYWYSFCKSSLWPESDAAYCLLWILHVSQHLQQWPLSYGWVWRYWWQDRWGYNMASYLGITSRVLGKQLSISWIMYFMQRMNSAQNKVCNQCPLNFVRINLSLTFLAFTSVSRAIFHITQLNSFCIRRSTSIKKLRSLLVLVPFQWGLSVFWRASMWSRHEHFSMPCLSDHLNQRY